MMRNCNPFFPGNCRRCPFCGCNWGRHDDRKDKCDDRHDDKYGHHKDRCDDKYDDKCEHRKDMCDKKCDDKCEYHKDRCDDRRSTRY